MSAQLAAFAAALLCSTAAQAQTVIVADGEPGKSTGTVVTTSGSTTTIDGGTQAGGNLFHSFADFSLATGDTAAWIFTFGDPNSIDNVINRVTGGNSSVIDGTIDSTGLPNASFFFINPAGVIFGENAQVNVPGAAHFSTASQLNFADGVTFSAVTPGGSTFTMAAPASFGFLGGEGALAVFGGGAPLTAQRGPITFTASDVTLSGVALDTRALGIVATGGEAMDVGLDGGRLVLPANVQSGGIATIVGSDIRLAGETGADSDTDAALVLGGGTVALDGGTLSIVADDDLGIVGGSAAIAADTLELTNFDFNHDNAGSGSDAGIAVVANALSMDGSQISALAFDDGDAASLVFSLGSLAMADSIIETVTNGGGDAGVVLIEASGDVALDASRIGSNTEIMEENDSPSGFGNAGGVLLSAANVFLDNASSIRASTNTDGDVGVIAVSTPGTLRLANGSVLSASNLSPVIGPRAGGILVQAGSVEIENGGAITTVSFTGDGGEIDITANSVLIDGGAIDSDVLFGGDGGSITIAAKDVIARNFSTISSSTLSDGLGGSIEITADSLALSESMIATDAMGDGDGGFITLTTGSLMLSDNSLVSSDIGGSGEGGDILVDAGGVVLDGSGITARTIGSGTGGIVTVMADTLTIDNYGGLSAQTFGAGDAGEIDVKVGSLNLNDGIITSSSTFDPDAGFVPSGAAGGVSITADSVFVGMAGEIESDTAGSGDAGDVTLTATSLVVDGGRISSNALEGASGDSGTVTINAGTALLTNDGGLQTASAGSGASGDIAVTAGRLTVTEGGYLDTDTVDGTGGSIAVTVSQELAMGARTYITAGTSGTGDAGDLQVTAGSIALDGARIEAESRGSGAAGSVSVTSPGAIVLENRSLISATTFADGVGGQVSVGAASIELYSNSGIVTQTAGSGAAGMLAVVSGSLTIDGGVIQSSSFVAPEDTSGTLPSGDAGGIAIQTGPLVLSLGTISSSTVGSGDAGVVLIEASSVELDRARIESRATPTASGGAGAIGIDAGDFLILRNASEVTSSNEGSAADNDSPGAVAVIADYIELANGSQITTNSRNGPAGAIGLEMPPGSILRLRGGPLGPSTITTSSGPGTGGVITIASPLAIVSQGGNILALGASGGANVVIRSQFYIDAADTLDVIAVDGDFTFDGQLDYIASGEEPRDVSLLDAGAVLSGRCRAAQARGGSSQLGISPIGPFGTYDERPAGDGTALSGDVASLASLEAAGPCG